MESNLTYIRMPELFEDLNKSVDNFFAIIDEAVKPHLPQWIHAAPKVYWLAAPEQNKNLQTYGKVLSFFLEQGIGRSSTLFAIGGGATTDLGGFVAATILRGVSWISIPTTLLAMVDGSLGGKVAVNLPQGKNLAGAFHAPERVLICQDFLSTLPESEWLSGKGEILKYGFLSHKIQNLIFNHAPMEEIAFECAQLKKEIVERDFKEQADRILLNFGHTLGHAFEAQLKIPHGVAVAMGIKYILELYRPQQLEIFEKLVSTLRIPTHMIELKNYPTFSLAEFLKYLEQDKKKAQDEMKLVLLNEKASPVLVRESLSALKSKIQNHAAFKH